MAERILVLGGTRSGKSAVAEALLAHEDVVRYVATATAGDDELAARIAAHRARRPAGWETVETADLAGAVRTAPPAASVLVDDLGGWLLAHDLSDAAPLLGEAEAFWTAAAVHAGERVVVVADESGLGITPADPLSRRWLDVAGDVVQLLSAAADRVLLVVAGRALDLPSPPGTEYPIAGIPFPEEQEPRDGGFGSGQLAAHGDAMAPAGALDFAVNVHGRPPAHVAAALAAADPSAYPDPGAAVSAVASRFARPENEVLPVAGAAEAFWLLARVAAARLAVCVHPSFTAPEQALRSAGVAVTRVYRRGADGWVLHPDVVPAAADLVVVGNPNNPTGTLDPADRIAALCRPGRLTVVDEAFMDFVVDEGASVASRRDLPGLIVVRSATKLWALAGVRAGALLAPPGLVARLRRARQPWPVSAAALAALVVVSGDDEHRRGVAAAVAVERRRLAALLARRVQVYDSAANFLLLRVPNGPAVHARLLERGVAVRPSTFPGLDADHLRVAVRDQAANDRLVAALDDVLSPTRT